MHKEAIQDAISMYELPSKWRADILKEANVYTKIIIELKRFFLMCNLLFMMLIFCN